MQINSDILEFKFSGNDINPEAVSLQETANNILHFDKIIKPILKRDFPDLDIDNAYVSFVDIGNRSLSYRYKIKQYKEAVLASFLVLTQAVSANSINNLPNETIKELESISTFNEKFRCNIHFGEVVNNNFKEITSFYNEFKSEKLGFIKGKTSVFGYIESIGGDKPQFRLKLKNGEKLNVSITKEEAIYFSNRLYKHIKIFGEATWKGIDLKLTSIKPERIEDFDNLNPDEGLDFLQKALSKYIDKDNNN